MSYDLAVFEVGAAPKGRADFLAWYRDQVAWKESHGYTSVEVTAPPLQAWLRDIVRAFPPMSGPLASSFTDDEDETRRTEYSIGRTIIYACFAWSHSEDAYTGAFALAGKHGVGFFDVASPTQAVWLPDGTGQLVLAHRG